MYDFISSIKHKLDNITPKYSDNNNRISVSDNKTNVHHSQFYKKDDTEGMNIISGGK